MKRDINHFQRSLQALFDNWMTKGCIKPPNAAYMLPEGSAFFSFASGAFKV